MKRIIVFAFACILGTAHAQTKILFAANKAQMAGNADWVVDADVFNIGTSSTRSMVTGAGNEANPQRIPTAAQSGITATTAETYWKGALSSWGMDLVRKGYTVETLPYNGAITYGVTTNAQDLANYKVFIVIEPNIAFTAAEKTAMMNFVQNGGGLFIGGNHAGSDRNNDGWDPVRIWNDFFRNNPVRSNPFGILFDSTSISLTTTTIAPLTVNSILKGPAGNVTGLKYDAGTTMNLNRTANATATGLVYRTGYSTTGTTQVMFASSTYGTGRVCSIGDSSPSDDGTGDSNDVLYSAYKTAASGSHQKLFINAVMWLAGTTALAAASETPEYTQRSLPTSTVWSIYPNPANDRIVITGLLNADKASVSLLDLTGRQILTSELFLDAGSAQWPLDRSVLPAGIYLLNIMVGDEHKVLRLILN